MGNGYGGYLDTVDMDDYKTSPRSIFNKGVRLRNIVKMPLKADNHAVYLAVEALRSYVIMAESVFKKDIEIGQKVTLGRLGAFELCAIIDDIQCDGCAILPPTREYIFDAIGPEWKAYSENIYDGMNPSPNDYFFMHYNSLSKYVRRLLLGKTKAHQISNPTIMDIFNEACKIQWRYESGVGNKTLNALIDFFEQFGLYLNR